MTLLEAIQCGISNIDIPKQTIELAALARNVDSNTIATVENLQSKEYRLMEADVKMWVARNANVKEGDVDISMLATTKDLCKAQANAVYKEFGDPNYDASSEKPKYGYKGTRL